MKINYSKCAKIFLGLCSIALGTACKQNKTPEKPNILFIMTDDHSLQTFSTYDNRFVETPNLDRIGKEGVVFRNSFVSNSICAPSRAVMLTGKHSHKNGQINNKVTFNGGQQTFPKLLNKAGYLTALIGKWHLKSEPTGFDSWDILIDQGQYYNPDFITNGEKNQTEGYVTNIITDKSINWLEKRDKSKPFCLLVHHKATHRVWMPDTTLFHLFKDANFHIPDNFFDDYEGRVAAGEQKMSLIKDMDLVYDLKMLDEEGEIPSQYRKFYLNKMKRMTPQQKKRWDEEYQPLVQEFKKAGLKGKDLAKWKYQRYMQDYLRCVVSVDNNVGRLLDYLDANNLDENTIVVYTSDQGFYMGEHGWFDKRFMYEQSLRTPLVMRYPKSIKPETDVCEMVQNIDYAPTFLDFAGVDIPTEMQGKSLVPLLNGENESWRNAIYYHYYEYPNEHMVKRHYGIRTGRYKLIHFYDDIDQWELYDLENDPDEMVNLYSNPELTDLIQSLKQRLQTLQIQYDDTDKSSF